MFYEAIFILSPNKQAISIKLATTVGHFYVTLTLQTFIWLADLFFLVQGGKRSSKTGDIPAVPLAFINGVGVSSDAMSEDSDVANERKRLNAQQREELGKTDPLVLMNLSKVCATCSVSETHIGP